ncbi:MAG TPA: hypothetical protein DEF51_52935 [Myxococcales bacterium]|nr:hypothetical protein [Myxococcales bacterium]
MVAAMRLLFFFFFCAAVALAGCADHHDRGDDAGAPAERDASPADPPPLPPAPIDAGPSCSCRTGDYTVEGEGDGFTLSYRLSVEECDGELLCTLDDMERRCMREGGSFRVYLDTDGYVQLIFGETPCDAPWTGRYATHGGSATVTASRIEED